MKYSYMLLSKFGFHSSFYQTSSHKPLHTRNGFINQNQYSLQIHYISYTVSQLPCEVGIFTSPCASIGLFSTILRIIFVSH